MTPRAGEGQEGSTQREKGQGRMTSYVALDGENFRTEMQRRGLTLKKLSGMSKISLQTVRRALEGQDIRSASAAALIKTIEATPIVENWEKYRKKLDDEDAAEEQAAG